MRGEGVAKERVSAETASIGRSSVAETTGCRGDFCVGGEADHDEIDARAPARRRRLTRPRRAGSAAICRFAPSGTASPEPPRQMCYFIGVGLWIASVAACSALALFHEGPCYFEYNNKTGSALSLWVLLLSIGCSGVCFVVWLVDDRKPRRKNDDDQRGLLAV